MMNELEAARQTELRVLRKLNRRAAALMAADFSLSLTLARAKAAQEFPKASSAYLQARQALGMAGLRPISFDQAGE